MKYIDAEKLKGKIASISLIPQTSADYNDGRDDMKMMVLDIIDSLQQEQQESSKGKFVFPKFLYARTTNNKTIDVSYAPQSLDAIEYVRKDAFIEKACKWINENITNNPNANSVLVRNGCVTLGMLVDDFKKYMKE